MFIFKNEDGTVAVGNKNHDGTGVEVDSLPDEAEFLLWNDADPKNPLVSQEAKVIASVEQLTQDKNQFLLDNEYTLTVAGIDYIYQVRPNDLTVFSEAIGNGVDKRWKLKNNTIRLTTVAEMVEVATAGKAQIEAIWDAHTLELDAL